jgi:aminobenzoyl-glutamate transport protein
MRPVVALVCANQEAGLRCSPAAVLAAHRVGDSPTNATTPMMAHFPLIVGFATKYQKGAGVGALVAMM